MHSYTKNILLALVIPHAIRLVADRLATALLALAERVETVEPRFVSVLLFCRLSALIRRCIQLSCNLPRRAAAKPGDPAAAPQPTIPPARPRQAAQATTLSRRRGWLLAVLPDDARAIVDELAALLADPAAAEMFALDPFLYRRLKPLLHLLGLAAPTPTAPLPQHPPTPTQAAPPPRTRPRTPGHRPPGRFAFATP